MGDGGGGEEEERWGNWKGRAINLSNTTGYPKG